jgi:cytochrome c-type biogenesis protein CcmE
MANIDDELRQVIDKQEGLVRPEPEPAQAFTRSPAVATKPTRQIGLLIGLIVISGAILLVVFSGFKQAAVYSKGVDELLREKSRFQSRTVRVLGTLVSGTLARRSQPCEYRFSMQKNDVAMTVFYPQCVVPDTFRDVSGVKVEVTAEGQLQKDGTFHATQIMAKCPSKYEMQGKANQGQAPSHSLIVDPGIVNAGVDSR